MSAIIPMQSRDHLAVVNVLRVLLRRAEHGEVDGFMYAMTGHAGSTGGISGLYDSDPDYASATAAAVFNSLLGHKACVDKPSKGLPRRLRKEDHENEPKPAAVRFRRC